MHNSTMHNSTSFEYDTWNYDSQEERLCCCMHKYDEFLRIKFREPAAAVDEGHMQHTGTLSTAQVARECNLLKIKKHLTFWMER